MQLAVQNPGSRMPPLARPNAGQQQQEGVLPQELATDGALPSLPRSPGKGLWPLQSHSPHAHERIAVICSWQPPVRLKPKMRSRGCYLAQQQIQLLQTASSQTARRCVFGVT